MVRTIRLSILAALSALLLTPAFAASRYQPTPIPAPAPVTTPAPTEAGSGLPGALSPALGVPTGYSQIYSVDWTTQGFNWPIASDFYRVKTQPGMQGYAYDIFLDPFFAGVPLDYLSANPIGPFELIPGTGLVVKSQPAPADLLALIKKLGPASGNGATGKPVGVQYVSAYADTRGTLEIAKPLFIEFEAAVDDPNVGAWFAAWGYGTDTANPIEFDTVEMFVPYTSSVPPYATGTTHYVQKGQYIADGDGSDGFVTPTTPLVGNYHQYGTLWAANGDVSYYLDGQLYHVTKLSALKGLDLTQRYVPILDLAAGYPWSGGVAPKRAMAATVRGLRIYAPSSAGSVLPKTPAPLPGCVIGSVSSASPVGTTVCTLTGGVKYAVVEPTGVLKASGAAVVTAKALTKGAVIRFVPEAIAADGTTGYGATDVLTVN